MGDYVYVDGGEMSQKLEEGDDDEDIEHTMSESRAPHLPPPPPLGAAHPHTGAQ